MNTHSTIAAHAANENSDPQATTAEVLAIEAERLAAIDEENRRYLAETEALDKRHLAETEALNKQHRAEMDALKKRYAAELELA